MLKLNEIVGRRIRRARKEAGLTQSELANLIGASGEVTISRYENGKSGISLEVIEAVAKATGKEPWWFLSQEEEDTDSWRSLFMVMRRLEQKMELLEPCMKILEELYSKGSADSSIGKILEAQMRSTNH